MLTRKRLAPESLYNPIRGINPEANGLSIRKDEAVLASNLRFNTDYVRSRTGSRDMSINSIQDAFLHFHTYKVPNGDIKLFAFSSRSIYVYNQTLSAWQAAIDHEAIQACDAATDFTTDATYFTLAASTSGTRVEGSGKLVITKTAGSATVPDGTVVLEYSGTSVMDKDLTDRTFMLFWTLANNSRALKLQLFTADDCSGTADEEIEFDVIGDYGYPTSAYKWWNALCQFDDPTGLGSIKSFRIITNGASTWATNDYLWIDDIRALSSVSDPVVQFWSTADFIDDTEGATVIAACSIPPVPDVAESDAASRKLFFYDVSASMFVEYVINRQLSVAAENTNVEVPGTGGGPVADTVIPDEMSSGPPADTIIPLIGFSILTNENGTLATASTTLTGVDGGANNGYLLLATNTTKITEGSTNSWVKTTGEWKITFAASHGYTEGAKLRMSYTFNRDSEFLPRYVISYQNRLLLASTAEGTFNPVYYPWRLRWTHAGKKDVINQLSYQELVDKGDVSSITALVYLRYFLIIYKHNSKVRVSPSQTQGLTFDFETIDSYGTRAGRTVVEIDNRHYFLGNTDVYQFDGTNTISITQDRETGSFRIRDYLFQLIDNTQINRHFAYMDRKANEYCVGVVKGSTSETAPTKFFVFNVLLGTWGIYDLPMTFAVGNYFLDSSSPTWDSLTGITWDMMGETWDTFTKVKMHLPIVFGRVNWIASIQDDVTVDDYGTNAHNGSVFGGLPIYWYLITRDFIWESKANKDRCTRVEWECLGQNSLTIGYSFNYEMDYLNFLQRESKTPTPAYSELKYFPDVSCEHIRFALNGSGLFFFRWLQAYAVITEIVGD